jgi:protein-tyrosine-phosphatase
MKILFVCTGNAFRSPIGEALLKKLRPDLEVDSAGTQAASAISEEAREYLRAEDAAEGLKKAPESLNSKPIAQYDLIIAMEKTHEDAILENCPKCRSKVIVWNVPDLQSLPPECIKEINDQIKKNVTELAKVL